VVRREFRIVAIWKYIAVLSPPRWTFFDSASRFRPTNDIHQLTNSAADLILRTLVGMIHYAETWLLPPATNRKSPA
jgi:hypothetical protein